MSNDIDASQPAALGLGHGIGAFLTREIGGGTQVPRGKVPVGMYICYNITSVGFQTAFIVGGQSAPGRAHFAAEDFEAAATTETYQANSFAPAFSW